MSSPWHPLVPILLAVLAGAPAVAAPGRGPVKVFILAGQSNMDGQAGSHTIDFLGEDAVHERQVGLWRETGDGDEGGRGGTPCLRG